jgi:uncharacterized membrane protein HdeD (DUF308 family)
MAYSTAAKPHHNTLDMRQHTFGNRMFFMFIGLLIVGLGILAIAHPFLTTLATKIFIGWTLLFVGIAQIFQSFSTRGWSEFALNLLIGFLYAAVGGWLIFFPLAGVLTLTAVLAATFIAQGVIEIVMGFRMRGSGGWFALLLAGAVAMTLGVMILSGMPSTAAWAIGLLVGVNLVVSGITYIVLALSAPFDNDGGYRNAASSSGDRFRRADPHASQ